MTKTTIKLSADPEIYGYEGAFLNNWTEDGKMLSTGWSRCWFEARATDEDENDYIVYWVPGEDFDPSEDYDTQDVDWDNPSMVLMDDRYNVTEQVDIKW